MKLQKSFREDSHGNKYTQNSTGIIIEDVNGNKITMESGKTTINGDHLEIT